MAKGIIDNYRELPIGKYEEIVKLCKTEMTEVDRKVAILSVLTGLTEDEVLHLPLATFTDYSTKARFIEHECPENLIPGVAKSYPIGGFVLLPVTDIRKITAAQYIDFQTFAQDRENKVVELLSCFLIPRGCDYNEGYDVLDVHTAIREEMSVAEGLALLAFFFKGWLTSIRNTLSSSEKMIKRVKNPTKRKELMERKKALEDSLRVGVGSLTSME
jgi:hypothetical protein